MVKYTVDQIIREFMIEVGDSNENKYARYLQHAISGLREFNFDLAQGSDGVPTPALLTINDNQTVDLPKDFINYTAIGVLDAAGTLHSLGLNNAMRRDNTVNNCGDPTLPAPLTGNQSVNGMFGGALISWEGFADNFRNGEVVGRFFGIGGGTNAYGYYRINKQTAQIELGGVNATLIYLEYLSDLQFVGGEYLVHPFCVEALKCYMYWKMNSRNDRKSGVAKQESRQEYFNEFARAKARFNSFTVDEWRDSFRRYNMQAARF